MSQKHPTAMIALGGNAISPKGEAGTIYQQFSHTRDSLDGLMHFVHQNYHLCITHGNGPQVGDELLRMDLTHNIVPPVPLGVCVAGTQGTIGYMVQQSLQNRLQQENFNREVVTLVTQVVIDILDPTIQNPSKYIGHRYSKEEIEPMVKKFGWSVKEQESGSWRRVVPSPIPQYIMHGKSIRTLVNNGIIVLASGGGGIPVFKKESGDLEGIDAVIDKDYAAALLGRIIKADELWIITDVDNVYVNYGTDEEHPITKITVKELEKLNAEGQFQHGSMKPKIDAALYFMKYHGKKTVITSIPNILKALSGKAGTTIIKE